MSVQEIRIDLIDTGRNVREWTDGGLVDSVRQHGILQAITVRRTGKRYRLVMGHRRLKAARLAGLKTIPAMVEQAARDDEVLRQLAENAHRRGMNAMDQARAIADYRDAHPGITHQELADAIGYPGVGGVSWVSNRLALLRLDETTQERVEAGELAPTLAIKQRPSLGDGRGHPKIVSDPDDEGRSRSIDLTIGRDVKGRHGRFSIGVDHNERSVDLVVEAAGQYLALTLSPDDAKLLGRRLTQAYEAVA